MCGLAVALSLAGCGRLQALIDPPTPRPPAPTELAPAVTPDSARVAEVFEPTDTPTPPPATATDAPPGRPAPGRRSDGRSPGDAGPDPPAVPDPDAAARADLCASEDSPLAGLPL